MTVALAPGFRQSLIDGTGVNLSTLNLKIVGADVTYVYSAAHDFLNDVGAGTRIATTANLTGKSVTDGYFNAGDVSLGSPVAGDVITQFWLYNDTPVAEADKRLIMYWDEDAATLPISIPTTGADITIYVSPQGFFRV